MQKIIDVAYKIKGEVYLKNLLLITVIITLLFLIIGIKIKNVELGYKIENLKKSEFEKITKIEALNRKIAGLKRTEVLLKKAKVLDLTIPQSDRVFYVE